MDVVFLDFIRTLASCATDADDDSTAPGCSSSNATLRFSMRFAVDDAEMISVDWGDREKLIAMQGEFNKPPQTTMTLAMLGIDGNNN
eukprot:scaffold102071_cov66-Cyclotella_meneghiniana.AAC.1